jgi:phenylalanine ammonia-lyase
MRAAFKHSAGADFMPEAWVRGAMLVRCKSLLAAYSAVRFEVIELLMALLDNDLIPLVPLRGSISASGDLQPLSYIAGVLEGNPDMYVWTSDGKGGRDLISADGALDMLKRRSITFGPKEALGVLNGTAVSTAVAALALQESHHLAVFSQILTAMGTEAMLGSVGNFNAFFAKVRPHRGQIEAAKNITLFLAGSQLARAEDADNQCVGGLKQDRYALRTSSQWIGPQLEDLILAHEQITTECNSTTDNPLIDVEGDAIHHGGNFQAASVTSAMEKSRASLQMFGRMLFSQCTELINPDLNSGLPPNLAADEPSTSYTAKGADINVAAYMSELAYLANPVSSHVQTAEMGNQAINSLALISARYTHTAIDCLSMICATYLYVLCQALDIRAMNKRFYLVRHIAPPQSFRQSSLGLKTFPQGCSLLADTI